MAKHKTASVQKSEPETENKFEFAEVEETLIDDVMDSISSTEVLSCVKTDSVIIDPIKFNGEETTFDTHTEPLKFYCVDSKTLANDSWGENLPPLYKFASKEKAIMFWKECQMSEMGYRVISGMELNQKFGYAIMNIRAKNHVKK